MVYELKDMTKKEFENALKESGLHVDYDFSTDTGNILVNEFSMGQVEAMLDNAGITNYTAEL